MSMDGPEGAVRVPIRWHNRDLTAVLWRLAPPHRYAGTIASIVTDEAEVYTRASVHGIAESELASNEFLLKEYSENAGLGQAFVAAKIVENFDGRFVESGYVVIPVVTVQQWVIDKLKEV